MPRPGAATACRTSSAIGRVSGEAGAKRRGVGEGKGGESPGASRGRGGKGAASGGGTERRSLLSEPSGRSASCRQSREAKPTASADSRAERERFWSKGEQGSGERASFEERRRRGTRRRAPENLASVPSGDSERVASRPVSWPSGDSYASCRRRAGAPGEQATKRSGADARGGLPPLLLLRGERTYKNQRKARPGALLAAGPGGD